jgi:hypothetical protein
VRLAIRWGTREHVILTVGKDTHLDATLFACLDESHLAPFPERKVLELRLGGIRAPAVLPDSFSIGPAPRLVQKHHLRGIPLLPVRELLLSSLDLIYPDLWNIPYCEYTSAEAMVTCLATVTRLKSLSLGFCFPRSGPASTYSLPPMHIVFLALTHFMFDVSLSPWGIL